MVVFSLLFPFSFSSLLLVLLFYEIQGCFEDSQLCPPGMYGPDGSTSIKRDPLHHCEWQKCHNITCAPDRRSCPDGLVSPSGNTFVKRDPSNHCNFQQCVRDDAPTVTNPTVLQCNDDFQFCPDGITIISRNPADNCNFFPCDTIGSTTPATTIPVITLPIIETPPENSTKEEEQFKLICLSDKKSCGKLKGYVLRDPNNLCEFPPC